PRTELLRTLHTLKGNAGMLGLSAIRDFVHTLETVFKVDPSSWAEPVVERLFEGVAALRTAVESAGDEGQEAAFRELAAARHQLERADAPGAEERLAVSAEPGGVQATDDRIRVPFRKLDALLGEVGELIGDAESLRHLAGDSGDTNLRDLADSLTKRADVLRESVLSLRLVPIGRILGRFHGLVRRLAREQGKEARLVLEGESTEIDKATADALSEPLLHLVRNAIDHGLSPPDEREAAGRSAHGTIRIVASHDGDRVRIAVEDDGVGVSLDGVRDRAEELGVVEDAGGLSESETLALIFRPGFSTRTAVSTVSGRGVGLDVVRRSVRELRGDLRVERLSRGTRFVLMLPLTVVIVPSLVFEAAGEMMALPASSVDRTFRVREVERVGATEVVRDGERLLPVADPDRLFHWEPAPRGDFGVLVRYADRGAVLTADRLIDQRELVVKRMSLYGRRPPAITGGSVLPGGRVILVLDPGELIELIDDPERGGRRG
ncbi:MAG: hypothetical protein GWM90_13975, partial [Gemmatimonadetes bacterium]|nr:hypothetical protein [Gemmatimonadota bacterium]NIQ55229.1 hypothetical protein [Gemmatimonadota bacterium]NIU75433.1 hypothetical protein [Gammaproteobacteria bacterium]NIX45177.1 hypothetical protein [Gemmatimonadota bacterium]NIY09420.1 hypothetical protein [Gemmatimonadota bacterium]